MGKPLTRHHVRHSVGPLQLQIGQLHQETLTGSGGFYGGHHTQASLAGAA